MPRLESERDELFCQFVALGKSAAQAYRLAGGESEYSNRRAADLRTKQDIQERIKELMEEVRQTFEFTREDLLNFYRETIITPVGSVDETSRLAQEVTTTCNADGTSKKVKMVGKIDAARELSKMLGWYEPEKVEVSGTLGGLLGKLTGAKK